MVFSFPVMVHVSCSSLIEALTFTQLSIPVSISVPSSGILHAYDATSVSTELWNSEMNATRDALGEGIGFSTPVVVNGRVITTYDTRVGIFGLLH